MDSTKDVHICPWCKKEYMSSKAYTFFNHKTGEWVEGHKYCMISLQLEHGIYRSV